MIFKEIITMNFKHAMFETQLENIFLFKERIYQSLF